jgi:deoxyribodipyrimidine photo-lyase
MKLVWFRNDLRVDDNPALYQACSDAGNGRNQTGVVAFVVVSSGQWHRHDDAPSKIAFWLSNLKKLTLRLAELNIPIKVIHIPLFDDIPEKLLTFAQEIHCDGLYFNREYCLNESLRDKAVEDMLAKSAIASHLFDGDVVFPPGHILTQQNTPYRVFTPFSHAWKRYFTISNPQPLPAPIRQIEILVVSDPIPEKIEYPGNRALTWQNDFWPPGEDFAHQRLIQFIETMVGDYNHNRNFPALDGTSSLSPYLTTGVLSVRQCIAALRLSSNGDDWLQSQWLSELIWREFYRHLIRLFPELNQWKPFRGEVERCIEWSDTPHFFSSWCEGETGFPIVDAGMKQLHETGWMHNRVRMIVASFLTKLLRQDWRKGARYFMKHLLDGDFASNLGGWQWSASVGADAAPYLRIFNPIRQAERFDPHGEYVARWLPQLSGLSSKQQHDARYMLQRGRPKPIIDYVKARSESLADYQRGKDRVGNTSHRKQ